MNRHTDHSVCQAQNNRNIMKKFFPIFALAFSLAACSGSDDVQDVKPPLPDVVLPQGGNEEADDSIQALFNQYDTYFLYKFTAEDFNWKLVSGGLFETQYRHTAINPDSVCNLLDAIKDTWLAFYPEEFNRRYMPRYVYLAQTIESGDVSYSYAEEDFVTKWTFIPARYQDSQVAVANIADDWQSMSLADRRVFKRSLQSVVLNYLASRNALGIPEAFYALSSYEGSALTSSKARKEGYIVNPATGKDWATTATQLTRQADLEAYLSGIAYYNSSEWRNVYSGNSVIRQKYDILVEALKATGIDVDAIRNY